MELWASVRADTSWVAIFTKNLVQLCGYAFMARERNGLIQGRPENLLTVSRKCFPWTSKRLVLSFSIGFSAVVLIGLSFGIPGRDSWQLSHLFMRFVRSFLMCDQ